MDEFTPTRWWCYVYEDVRGKKVVFNSILFEDHSSTLGWSVVWANREYCLERKKRKSNVKVGIPK